MDNLTIYCNAHYFKSSHRAYGGYIMQYNDHFKTYVEINIAIDADLICLELLWQSVSLLKKSCDIRIVSRFPINTPELKSGKGSKLWEFLNDLRVENGHKYTFDSQYYKSDIQYLEALEAAIVEKHDEEI